MATQPIDYAALAKQFGATSSTPPPTKGSQPDYAAIAKQYGATDYTPPPQQQPEATISNQPRTLPGLESVLKGWLNGVSMISGAAKTAAQPVATLSSILNKVPVVGEYLAPSQGVSALHQILNPNGPWEKAGGAIEQAGEMAATGGPLRKGAEELAAHAPSAFQAILNPVARVGAEAVNAGGNAAAHGQPAAPAAATGAAGATVGELAPVVAPALKKAAVNVYSKALSPTKGATKYEAQQVVPELIKRGEFGSTAGMLESAERHTDDVGGKIDQVVSQVPASVKPDPNSVIQHLEDYKNQFRVAGPNGSSVDVDPDAINRATELQQIIHNLGPDVSYQSLNKVRQIWDSKVAKAGGYVGKTLSEGSAIDAQREGANAIRAELSQQSPDISKLNAEFHFWRGVEDVLGQTALRRTGQEGGLIANAAPYLGAMAGIEHGGFTRQGGMEAALSSAAMLAVAKATKSPMWRTASGVLKDRIATGLMSGNYQLANQLATRIAAGSVGQNSSSSPSSQQSTQ